MEEFSVIGLTGRAGAGKDTVAEILKEAYGHVPVAFASVLRAEVAAAFGVDVASLLHRATKELPSAALAIYKCQDKRFVEAMQQNGLDVFQNCSPRQILRWWGTEYRRECHSHDYWTERLSDTIETLFRAGVKKIAVTDVRFTNEAHFVRSIGGEVWRIERDEAERQAADHASEVEQRLIEADKVIVNNKSLGSLVYEVIDAYGEKNGETSQ